MRLACHPLDRLAVAVCLGLIAVGLTVDAYQPMLVGLAGIIGLAWDHRGHQC